MRKFVHLNTPTGAVLAVAQWRALGLRLGWYYTFTYYGRAGWPRPTPVRLGARLGLPL